MNDLPSRVHSTGRGGAWPFSLSVVLIALTLGEGTPTHGAETVAPRRPNVLLVLTDDQGWGDVRSHGNEQLHTPVLDRLAASGARFDRFFVSPVCSPTRASVLTGRYHLRTGVHGVTRGNETMRSEETTVAEVFQAAGYATGCFGKWHNGAHFPHHPNGQGFDQFTGFCAGHWNNYFDAPLEHNGQPIETKGYLTDVLTDAALRFIETNRDRPFFCYVPYNVPHSPFQVPDRFFDPYKARGLDDTTACVYAMCEHMDASLGRLLDKLDERGLAERTIVLFLTDNGPNTERFNGGMKGRKGSVDEGGVRVPLFVRWPGQIQPGTVVRPIASHIDLLPTLVELAGVPMPKTLSLDGVSLVPLLRGQTANWPERTLFSHWSGEQVKPERGSLRTERWRLVRQPKAVRLYDMTADPGQMQDVAKEHPEVVRELSAAYDAWFADVTKAGFDVSPVPVGHANWPQVELPGHEAELYPGYGHGISYRGRAGWANDWITNWTSLDAYPFWELDVVRPGRYEVTLLYTSPMENVGARVRVEVGGRNLEGTVSEAHDPAPRPSRDRVPRGEVVEKDWAPWTLGSVDLPAGRTQLRVRALTCPGTTVIDLKAVRLRRT